MTGWREAYGARAREYADFIGRLDLTDDRAWIDRWAGSITGPVLDLGCGPGHWTAHLTASGHDVSGIDPVLRDAPRPAASRPTNIPGEDRSPCTDPPQVSRE